MGKQLPHLGSARLGISFEPITTSFQLFKLTVGLKVFVACFQNGLDKRRTDQNNNQRHIPNHVAISTYLCEIGPDVVVLVHDVSQFGFSILQDLGIEIELRGLNFCQDEDVVRIHASSGAPETPVTLEDRLRLAWTVKHDVARQLEEVESHKHQSDAAIKQKHTEPEKQEIIRAWNVQEKQENPKLYSRFQFMYPRAIMHTISLENKLTRGYFGGEEEEEEEEGTSGR
ncbi:hypothetical protein C8J56DRAFT_891878 [Mycena floridula]|nr:hypothetical protein C8J56DRAFT_891878 [Mycena floridula]